jgi:type IV secretory pathway TrbD component
MSRFNTVHKSLNDPRLIFGVDRGLLILVLMGTAAICVATRSMLPCIGGIALLYVLFKVFSDDPNYLRVYQQYSEEADVYEPWVRPASGRSGRRAGHGKGVMC